MGGGDIVPVRCLTRLQDRADCSKGTELHWGRGGTPQRKTLTGSAWTLHIILMGDKFGGVPLTYFVELGLIGVGTQHNMERPDTF